jgi:hypothetical protein
MFNGRRLPVLQMQRSTLDGRRFVAADRCPTFSHLAVIAVMLQTIIT